VPNAIDFKMLHQGENRACKVIRHGASRGTQQPTLRLAPKRGRAQQPLDGARGQNHSQLSSLDEDAAPPVAVSASGRLQPAASDP